MRDKKKLERVIAKWEKSQGKGLHKDGNRTLAIRVSDIETMPTVFQPREFLTNTGASDTKHIKDLVKLLGDKDGGEDLDPILVLPLGYKAVVLDGHHRLEAYKQLGKKEISVKVFDGHPKEALLASAKENSKVRLQMSSAQRSQAAWELVSLFNKEGERFTREAIIGATGVGRGTVRTMRAVLKELLEDGGPIDREWRFAKYGTKEMQRDESFDDLRDTMSTAWALKIQEVLPRLDSINKVEAFAEAITKAFPQRTMLILESLLAGLELEDMESLKETLEALILDLAEDSSTEAL